MGKPQYPDTCEVLIALIEGTKQLLTVVILAVGSIGCLIWLNAREGVPTAEPPASSTGREDRARPDLLGEANERIDSLSGRATKPFGTGKEGLARNRPLPQSRRPFEHIVKIQNHVEVHGDVNIRVAQSQTNVEQTTAFGPSAPSVGTLQTERSPDMRDRARRTFGDGVHKFWSSESSAALQRFERAHELDATDARPLYFCALTHLRAGRRDLAEDALAKAVEVESQYTVENWGRMMERVQGRQRLWIEDARLEAGL